MVLNCGVGEDAWESLGLQGDPTSQSGRKSVLYIYWKDWCWNWNSDTLATWCKELTYWKKKKKPWCWERLKAGGEGDNTGWDGWMASLTQWSWVWVSSGSWWWTGRPSILQSMALERFRHGWVTELNSTRQKLLLGGEELGLLWSQVYVSLCKGTNTPSVPHFSRLICPEYLELLCSLLFKCLFQEMFLLII